MIVIYSRRGKDNSSYCQCTCRPETRVGKRFGEVDYLAPIGYILLPFYKPLLVCILHVLVKNILMKKHFNEFASPVGVCVHAYSLS